MCTKNVLVKLKPEVTILFKIYKNFIVNEIVKSQRVAIEIGELGDIFHFSQSEILPSLKVSVSHILCRLLITFYNFCACFCVNCDRFIVNFKYLENIYSTKTIYFITKFQWQMKISLHYLRSFENSSYLLHTIYFFLFQTEAFPFIRYAKKKSLTFPCLKYFIKLFLISKDTLNSFLFFI